MKTTMLHKAAEVELIYRNKVPAAMRPKVNSTLEAYELVMQSWSMEKIDFIEQFKVMLLNNANHVLGISEIASGGVGGVLIDPRLIYISALKLNATGIVLFHNHPSGSLKPSNTDIKLTQTLIKGGLYLDLVIVDHIIVTSEGYFSLEENGYLMPSSIGADS